MIILCLINMCNLFKPNDWYPVWYEEGEWEYEDVYKEMFECPLLSKYEILFSLKRNKYKLKISGYNPKHHSKYRKAIKKLNELIDEKHTY